MLSPGLDDCLLIVNVSHIFPVPFFELNMFHPKVIMLSECEHSKTETSKWLTKGMLFFDAPVFSMLFTN